MKKIILKKLHVILPLIVVFVVAIGTIANSYSGSDAPSWAASAVNQACRRGLIDCSLANPQFSSVLNRAVGYQMLTSGLDVLNPNARSPFRDVSGQWYASAAHSAYTLGWTVGTFGRFLGNENFTRAQMAVAISSALGLTSSQTNVLNSYLDSSEVPTWARGPFSAMVSAGLMGQGGNLNLRPSDSITKLEAIVVLNSAVTYVQTRSINVVQIAAQRIGVTPTVLQNALATGMNIVDGVAVTPSPYPNFFYAMRSAWTNDTRVNDFQTGAIRDLGMPYIQGYPAFFWGSTESGTNGDIYKWNEIDEQINKVAQAGLQVIPFFQTPKLVGLHWNQTILRSDPRFGEEYGEYVYEVVNRYKNHPAWSGMIAVWGGSSDIWEPNVNQPEVVVPLLNAVYDGAKRADPSTIVIGFNMGSNFSSGPDWEQWNNRAFALQPRFDWFGVQTHGVPVGTVFNDSQYGGVMGLANIRRFLDERGYADKPLFLNEGGFPIFNSAFDQQAQAQQAVQTYIAARTLPNVNLKGWVYFDIFGVEHSTSAGECGRGDGDNWGIMSCVNLANFSSPAPRPAYNALRTLLTTVNFPSYNFEAQLAGQVNQPAPYIYKFSKATNSNSKLWVIFSPQLSDAAPAAQDATVNISPFTSATRIDMFGNQSTVQASPNGVVTVRSTGQPVYIKAGN